MLTLSKGFAEIVVLLGDDAGFEGTCGYLGVVDAVWGELRFFWGDKEVGFVQGILVFGSMVRRFASPNHPPRVVVESLGISVQFR